MPKTRLRSMAVNTILHGYALDLVQIRALAKEKEDESWRFLRRFVKCSDLDPDEMDL